MSKEDYIPISARFEVELKTTPKITASDDFTALSDDCSTAMKIYQERVKQNIIKTVDLEIKNTELEIKQLFCTACHKVASSLLLEKNPLSLSKKQSRNLSLLCIQAEPLQLIPTGMDRIEFYEKFQAASKDPEVDPVNGPTNLSPEDKKEVEDLQLRDKLRNLLDNIFRSPWSKLQKVQRLKETEKQLATFFTEGTLEQVTEDTAMTIDAQPIQDAETINKLIAEAVSKNSKELHKKITTLEQKLSRNTSASNTPGATSSAQPKKMTTPKRLDMTSKARQANKAKKDKKIQQTAERQRKKSNASPDGHDSDTSKNNSRKNNNARKNASPKKSKASTRASKPRASRK